jgi:hypothetical protein
VRPADVTVAVLNGTTVTGLAARVADEIRGRGFRVPDELVDDARVPRAATAVAYEQGARRQAIAVARAIGLGEDSRPSSTEHERRGRPGHAAAERRRHGRLGPGPAVAAAAPWSPRRPSACPTARRSPATRA